MISADGHPVRGAWTFAVGPNAGPPPQFVIPSISETAATPGLVILRWIVFLSLMAAVGLFVMRIAIARRLVRLRWVTIAWASRSAVALVSTLIYVDVATAKFALRSAFDLGTLIPLMHDSMFGKGYLTLALCLLLFAYAGAMAIWLDRPERPRRSTGALLALAGAFLAAGAAILAPAVTGHAGQTSPRGLAIPVDWIHIAAGAVWIGGLIGLLVIAATHRAPGLVKVVPRFSNVAFVSVMALIAAGIGNSLFHLPTLASLWETSYGKMVLIKIGVLAVAMLVASGNFLRNAPRLRAAERRPDLAEGAASSLWKLVSVEVVLVVGIIFCAALLTSLAPPVVGAREGGEGERVRRAWRRDTRGRRRTATGSSSQIAPNRAAVENDFSIKVTKDGEPVTGARVTTGFSMLDMEMGTQSYDFRETAPASTRARRPPSSWSATGGSASRSSRAGGAVHRPLRRQGRWLMVWIRFASALLALAAGMAAVVVVILLIHQTVT